MLQEEMIAEQQSLDHELCTDSDKLGLKPLPDFQAAYDKMVYAQVEASTKGPNPQTYEQIHARLQAESEDEQLADEQDAEAHVTADETEPARPGVQYVSQAELDAEVAKLQELSKQAMAGDTKSLDQLRSQLDECPHIYRRLGDLQVLVEEKIVAQLAPDDQLHLEAYRKRASEMRCHLQGDSQDLLIQMAVSRVVACWLFTQFLELRILDGKHSGDGVKQLDQAERRLQTAIRSLTLAKKLEKHLASA